MIVTDLCWIHCIKVVPFLRQEFPHVCRYVEAEPAIVTGFELGHGEGPQGLAAVVQGGQRPEIKLAIEFSHEDHAGGGFYGPEGAENVGDALGEEGAGEADVFGGDGLVAGEGGFATGEGDEAVAAQRDLAQVLDGEEIWAFEGKGGLFGVVEVVASVAVEVEDLVGLPEDFADVGGCGFGSGNRFNGMGGAEELVDQVGFGLGVVQRI